MKSYVRYSISIGFLFLFAIISIQNSFFVYNVVNQHIAENTVPISTIINQRVRQNITPVANVVKPKLDSVNEDLSDFPSYSEAVHRQLFNRTTYVNNESHSFSEFASIIAKAVGLDQSSQLKMTRELVNSTVLILSANIGYADMTFNFLCRLAKISKTFKYVVIAQDASFYSFLQSRGIPSIRGSLIHPVSAQYAKKFRSRKFNAISLAKIIAARIVLELGYNVLFSDVDIAWKRNPVPFLPADVDLAIQSNSGANVLALSDEPNTGFYFLKSNDRSMTLLDDTINRARKNLSLDDQTHFGCVLRDWRTSKKAIFIMEGMTAPWVYNGYRPFTFRILHPYFFQPGQVASASYAKEIEPPYNGKDQDVILVHANYLVGRNSKIKFLKSHGLWDLNDRTFATYFTQWKASETKNEKQKNQDQEINYQLALDKLRQVCVNSDH